MTVQWKKSQMGRRNRLPEARNYCNTLASDAAMHRICRIWVDAVNDHLMVSIVNGPVAFGDIHSLDKGIIHCLFSFPKHM